jgi:hypothetical protein
MGIKICVGSHGGINNMCASCKHDMSHNHDDFQGTKNEPPEKYEFVNVDICTLVKPYWSQYEAKKIDA